MSLLPTQTERLAQACNDLRLGLPVVLESDDETIVVLAAEDIMEDRLRALRALGVPRVVVTAWRAETLRMRVYDGDVARVGLPADAGATWVSALADPKDDLKQPMKGPFQAVRDGNAALDRLAIRLAKSAHLLPACVVVPITASMPELTAVNAQHADALLSAPMAHNAVVSGRIPMDLGSVGKVHVFRPNNGGEEHVACEIGSPARNAPVLARLHSACFTGDVLGSLKCDCGPQLRAALGHMSDAGHGVLLYLNQEGRGIGLANKMRAYSLQDQGFDTVEANHRLGFEDDERDFRVGADLLKRMGFKSVRLMTNNPAKVEMMQSHGIDVAERVPLKVGRGQFNAHYLDVKAQKSGHLL